MKLSRKTHQKLESFFREYFADDKLNLPEIEIYAERVAQITTRFLDIHGITFGRRVLVKPNLIRLNENRQLCISKELLAHEATHVLQYQKLGFFNFFWVYLKGYFAALRRKEKWDYDSRMEAYLEIPQEQEARRCAAEFLKWSSEMKN